MNTDRRSILALIAMGRITPAEAERLLAAWNESRETAWILAFCLAVVCMSQANAHEPLPMLVHFVNMQLPALAEAVHHAITGLMGGLL